MKNTETKLIDDRGRVRTGVFSVPVDHINYLDYDLRTTMDKPRSGLARRWRFNQFQFVSVMSDNWLFGLAIVDLKLVSTGFFYLYDFETGDMFEQSLTQPFARGTVMAPYPERGEACFAARGTRLGILPHAGGRNLSVSVGETVRADIELEGDHDPLRLASPAGYTGWVFTRKSAGLPASGEIRWGDRIWRCDERTHGTIDWSGGFMRRETAWNWACLAGCLADGTSVGLNLATGVNESGMTENALWLNGECIKLDFARFEFDRYDRTATWRVATSDGRVDLRFVPSGVRKERLNVWVLASNFRQYAGTFEGVVVDNGGKNIPVAGLRGLMEDHFARW
ncbi:MAG: DUF2804 domain-containing protein [Marinobacter sp.]|uniref:DUF2804 domain-containing protein n=1 Tax=Marinobacter sp. TaxID=50741 RepID=UPI003C5A0066